jgi:hypothetical protein
MTADSNSHIAWQRVQLKRNRAALKELEFARFRTGHMAASADKTERAIAELKQKITESERCIADHERRTRRPLATDLRSLASVSWSSWDANFVRAAPQRQRA